MSLIHLGEHQGLMESCPLSSFFSEVEFRFLGHKSSGKSATSHVITLVFTALITSISYAFGYKQNKLTLDNLQRTEHIREAPQIAQNWWNVENLVQKISRG